MVIVIVEVTVFVYGDGFSSVSGCSDSIGAMHVCRMLTRDIGQYKMVLRSQLLGACGGEKSNNFFGFFYQMIILLFYFY